MTQVISSPKCVPFLIAVWPPSVFWLPLSSLCDSVLQKVRAKGSLLNFACLQGGLPPYLCGVKLFLWISLH